MTQILNRVLTVIPLFALSALPAFAANSYSAQSLCAYPATYPKEGDLTIAMRNKDGSFNAAPTDIRAAYLKALFKANPLVVDPETLSNPKTNIFASTQAMAKHLSGCQNSSDAACATSFAIYSDIGALFSQSETLSGGFHLARPKHATQKGLRVQTLADFLTPNGGYQLHCKTLSGEKPVKTENSTETLPEPVKTDLDFSNEGWVIAGDIESIEKSLKDRKSAGLSLDLDRGNKAKYKIDPDLPLEGENIGFTKNEKVSANVIVAYPGLLSLLKPHQDGVTSVETFVDTITPYAQLQYESNIDPEVETDNLSFGVTWNRKLSWNDLDRDVGKVHNLVGTIKFQTEFDRYLFNGRYITDIEERKSQQYFYDLKVPMANLTASLWDFDLIAGASAVLDYSDIDEVNDKVALNKLKTFARSGYDLSLSAHVPDVFDWHMDTNIKYFYRDSFGKNNADADKWEFVFGVKPDDESNLSFELKYDRGEVLTSLEEVETWKFGLGYKL